MTEPTNPRTQTMAEPLSEEELATLYDQVSQHAFYSWEGDAEQLLLRLIAEVCGARAKSPAPDRPTREAARIAELRTLLTEIWATCEAEFCGPILRRSQMMNQLWLAQKAPVPVSLRLDFCADALWRSNVQTGLSNPRRRAGAMRCGRLLSGCAIFTQITPADQRSWKPRAPTSSPPWPRGWRS